MVKSSEGNRRNALVNLAASVGVIAGMKAASSLIVPFLLALFLKKIKVPDVIAFLLILMLVIGLWMLLVVVLGSTLQEFTRRVPAYQDRMKQLISDGYTWLLAHDIAVDRSMVDSIFDPGKIMRLVTSLMNSLVAILKNVFFILLMFAFLIIEASGIPDKIKTIRHNREGSLSSYDAVIGMENRYLGIKFITSIITGAMIYMGLLYIGVDFSILWAVLSFILNFVPTIGSLIASIPAILLALVQLGPVYAFGTSLLFLFVNTAVGTIAEPRIMGQRVGLSSIVVFHSSGPQ
nr:AI-2E family transporter [uncultured Desulfobacter sp.]